MLAEVFTTYTEQGDIDTPKLVIFINKAHLVFEEVSKKLLNQIASSVKLIRAKGIGLFLVTYNPKDMAKDILAQLG